MILAISYLWNDLAKAVNMKLIFSSFSIIQYMRMILFTQRFSKSCKYEVDSQFIQYCKYEVDSQFIQYTAGPRSYLH
jgi:hypothetical protein